MALVSLLQRSFNAGELSPRMNTRSDQDRYKAGCRTLKNAVLFPHGTAERRPGMRFIYAAKTGATVVRLIPFEFSTEQAYVLEFGYVSGGTGYMRVFKDGGVVLSGASPYEITTPFTTEAIIRGLKFCQSADVMYITHASLSGVYKLSRTGHTSWTLAAVTFQPSISAPTGVTVAPQGTTGSTTYDYVVTAVNASEEESLASTSGQTTTGNATLSATNYNKVTWTAASGAVYYNVYRKKDGIWAYIGKSGTDLEFHDVGEKTPNVDETPATSSRNPFSSTRPSAVSFYEQRLCFGMSQTVYTSQTANGENLNTSTPLRDDDACTYKVSSDRANVILWLAPGKKLYVGTSGGEFVLSGSGNEAMTPTSVKVDRESVRGAHDIQPITVGNILLFVQRPGNVVREFKYSLDVDGFDTSDLSILSQHLLEEKTIREWAHQQAPLSTVWVVTEDGSLFALAYNREHEIVGWTPQETDGLVESVACIPGDQEDEAWFCVRRYINGAWVRYIERLDPLFAAATTDTAFFVDSGVSLNSPVTITAITNASPPVVTAASHGFSNGDTVRITGAKKRVLGDNGAYTLVPMTDVNDKRFTVANVAANTFELSGKDSTAWGSYFEGGEVRKCVTTVTGADHLEGRKVQVLADGAVHPPKTVSSGSITLDYAASHVHVGLGYISDMVPMNPDIYADDGTLQGKTKRIALAWARVHRTVGFKYGPSEDDLTSVNVWSDLFPGGTAIPPTTRDVKLEFDGGYDPEAMFLLRQDDPLPLAVTAIIMQVEVGDA
jgi:hypothetical protein